MKETGKVTYVLTPKSVIDLVYAIFQVTTTRDRASEIIKKIDNLNLQDSLITQEQFISIAREVLNIEEEIAW